MRNQLMEQLHAAPEFLNQGWREHQRRIKHTIEPLKSGIKWIYLTGCGDSYHAAVGLHMAFRLWSRCWVGSVPAMQLGRYMLPDFSETAQKTLVIGISNSGEVARTLEAIELAREIGINTLAMTSAVGSSLARAAHQCLHVPSTSHSGPGLLSYLASLMTGFMLCAAIAEDEVHDLIVDAIRQIVTDIEPWLLQEESVGINFADQVGERVPIVFLGAGPAFGSAMFSAAKAIEAAGVPAWAQDLEEWAHLEYFCEPDSMPTWILMTYGRAKSREQEVLEAARVIGRKLAISKWAGREGLTQEMQEALSPLVLWAGPAAFAATLADRLGEPPFRGFGGGRSKVEGGGASRIRSSKRARMVDLIASRES